MRNSLSQDQALNKRSTLSAELLVSLTMACALLHPRAFGLMWMMLLLAGLWWIVSRGSGFLGPDSRLLARIWVIAFGPLLIFYLTSIIVHGSSIGRIEPLEPVIGGLILAITLPHMGLHIQSLLRGAALGGLFAVGVTIIEMAMFHEPRAGMQFHPINFGIVCGAALLLLISQPKERFSPAWMVGTVCCGIGMLASGSRGPILAFFLSVLALFVLFPRKDVSSASRRWPARFLMLLIVAGAAIIAQRFLVDIRLGDSSSASIRWQLIQVSIEQILKSPWFGIGADRAGAFYSLFSGPFREAGHAHMTPLNLGLELGILAALSWVWGFFMVGHFFWKLRALARNQIWITGVTITAYLFLCSMTQELLSHAFSRQFLGFVLVVLLVIAQADSKTDSERAISKASASIANGGPK